MDYKPEPAQHILHWAWRPSSWTDDFIQTEGVQNWEDNRSCGRKFKNPQWTGEEIITHFIGWTSLTLDELNALNELWNCTFSPLCFC